MEENIKDEPKRPKNCKEDIETSKDMTWKPITRNNNWHGAVVCLWETMLWVVVACEKRHLMAALFQCQSNVNHKSFCTSDPQVRMEDSNLQWFFRFFCCFHLLLWRKKVKTFTPSEKKNDDKMSSWHVFHEDGNKEEDEQT